MGETSVRRAVGFDRFQTMSMLMTQFPDDSDAWQDFVADCERRVRAIPSCDRSGGLPVPSDLWAYWISVARGFCADYDGDGARVTAR
jgi:hypothetical protein